MAFKTKLIDQDLGWNRFRALVKSLDGKQVTVGVQGSEAEQSRGENLTNAKLATIHEFGAVVDNGFGRGIQIPIPQRSFLRSTFDENRSKYERLAFVASKKAIETEQPVKAYLELGERVRSDVIRKIKAGIPGEPAEKSKGLSAADFNTTPRDLRDTGVLINAITVGVTDD